MEARDLVGHDYDPIDTFEDNNVGASGIPGHPDTPGLHDQNPNDVCGTVKTKERSKKTSGEIKSYVNRPVSIITTDGRNFVGKLKVFDQTINLTLDETHERVLSATQGVKQVMLGLHIIRGDNICVRGETEDTNP